MIKGLSHVCIYMSDLKEAERIFVDTLGMPYIEEYVNGDGKKYGFVVEAGGRTFVKVIQSDLYMTRYAYHICLEVEDIYKFHELLIEMGNDVTIVKRGIIDKALQFFWYTHAISIEFCQFDEESVFKQRGLV
jgi:catechol 2,3-dioxygenase-like lactoylglutathione lyase family enzyme